MSVQELDAKLQGGQRTNRFRALLVLPSGVSGNTDELKVLCQSTTVPGKTRGAISIQRLGKTARIAGDEVSDETFTFMVQVPKNAQSIYNTFNEWFKLGNNSEGYKSTATFDFLGLDNSVTMSWKATGVWVSTLPPVNFDATAQDEVSSFEVTLTLDWIEPA